MESVLSLITNNATKDPIERAKIAEHCKAVNGVEPADIDNDAFIGYCEGCCGASGGTTAESSCAALPFYVFKSTPEERKQKLQWMQEQVSLILDQQRIEAPMQHVKIRCGCNKLVGWMFMYRCLYCGIWYCKDCAEKHFGMRVPPMEVSRAER